MEGCHGSHDKLSRKEARVTRGSKRDDSYDDDDPQGAVSLSLLTLLIPYKDTRVQDSHEDGDP